MVNKRNKGRRLWRTGLRPLPAPGLRGRRAYYGMMGGNSKIAIVLPTAKDKNSYRVNSIIGDFAATNVGMIQLALRGETSEQESAYSPIQTIGSIPKRVSVRQDRGSGYWEPLLENEHLGWITNSSSTPVTYSFIVNYSVKEESTTKFSVLHQEVIYPGNNFNTQVLSNDNTEIDDLSLDLSVVSIST
jgi:hypothetical protein